MHCIHLISVEIEFLDQELISGWRFLWKKGKKNSVFGTKDEFLLNDKLQNGIYSFNILNRLDQLIMEIF